MPFDAEFELPDGRVVKYEGIPDGTTKEQFQAQVQKEMAAGSFGKIEPKAAEVPETPGLNVNARTAKLLGSSAIRGAAALPALAAQLSKGAAPDIGADPMDPMYQVDKPAVSSAAGAPDFVGGLAKMGTQPVTTGEKYLNSIVESAVGALAGPGGVMTAPIRAASTGAAAGLGAEVAGQLSGDNMLARLFGSLVGGAGAGGLGALAARHRPQTEDLARVGMQNVSEKDLRAAQKFQAEAKAQGVDMDLSQALHGIGKASPELSAIREAVANSRSGGKVSAVLNKQGTGLEQLADTTVGQLPGPKISRTDAAREITNASDDTLRTIRSEGSHVYDSTVKEVRELLKATENVKVQGASAEMTKARDKLRAMEAEVIEVRKALTGSKMDDQTAINLANKKVQDFRDQMEALKGFALPRGRAETNRGTLLDASGRGQSIDLDQSSREGKLAWMEGNVPGEVPKADSVITAGLKKSLGDAEGAAQAAKVESQGAMSKLRRAQAGEKAITTIPESVIERQAQALRNEIAKQSSGPGGMAEDLKALVATLHDQTGKPLTDPVKLDKALKEFGDYISLPTSATGLPRGNSKQMFAKIAEVRDNLGPSMVPFKEATSRFKSYIGDNYDPVKGGIVGEMRTNRQLRDSDQVNVVAGKLEAMFNAGSDAQIAQQSRNIPKLANELKKNLERQGVEGAAEAFPAAANVWLRGKLDKAFEGLPAGSASDAFTSSNSAKVLYDSLFKTRGQMQGMRDLAAGVARSYDLPEHEVVKGLENLAQITKALTNAPRNLSGLSPQEIRQIASSSMSADAVRLLGYAPMNRMGAKIQEGALQKTFRDFDKILTTPEGADLLIQLSKTPTISKKSIYMLQQFSASTAAAN